MDILGTRSSQLDWVELNQSSKVAQKKLHALGSILIFESLG